MQKGLAQRLINCFCAIHACQHSTIQHIALPRACERCRITINAPPNHVAAKVGGCRRQRFQLTDDTAGLSISCGPPVKSFNCCNNVYTGIDGNYVSHIASPHADPAAQLCSTQNKTALITECTRTRNVAIATFIVTVVGKGSGHCSSAGPRGRQYPFGCGLLTQQCKRRP